MAENDQMAESDQMAETKWLKALFDMSLGVRYTSLLVTKGYTDIDQYAREADKLHDMHILQDLRNCRRRHEQHNYHQYGDPTHSSQCRSLRVLI